jgi:serine/threonine-protein kinase RIO1
MNWLVKLFRTQIQNFRKRRELAKARRRRMKELRKRDPFIY